MTHYIHRPTPEGGETDPRFRELTRNILEGTGAEVYTQRRSWSRRDSVRRIDTGTIWRIPGSDAPSAELLALANATRETG